FHECSICKAAGLSMQLLDASNHNIFVPGINCVYVAPGGIDHYFEAHAYCPSEEFWDAVLRCPDCDTPEYWDALRRSNGGPVPLMHLVKLEKGDDSFTEIEIETKGERFAVVTDQEFLRRQ